MSNVSPTYLELLTAATATNSPPSGAGAGKSLQGMKHWDEGVLFIWSTAGTTPTGTFKWWGYKNSIWFPVGMDPSGSGTASKYGLLNGGSAIGPYTGSITRWTDTVSGLSALDRVYLEITVISGSSAAFSARLYRRRVES